MSVEDLHAKILSRLTNTQFPTPCQIQRQIEENRVRQERFSKITEKLNLEDMHPSLIEKIANKGPEFVASLRANLEEIKKWPDGEILISLIEADDVRNDGTIRIKRVKKRI